MDAKSRADRILHLARTGELPRKVGGRLRRAYDALTGPGDHALPPSGGDGAFLVAHRAEDAPFLTTTPEVVARWNHEWLRYLEREWPVQLTPHTAHPERPPLPEDPRALIDLSIGTAPPLSLYCDREAIEGRRLLEVGCGCGNLGKLISRYAESYLGVDYSTLALAIARLVSPSNATYVFAGDHAALRERFGTIDTAVGRFFWIHQNLELGRRVLELIEVLLAPGGRIYADFFWPDPDRPQNKVFTPRDPLSALYPSATFAYARADVEALIAGRPFEVVREELHVPMQRRYVVLEKRRAG